MSSKSPIDLSPLLEQTLGHTFADRGLLLEALTHSSFSHEQNVKPLPPYNERLEFLGDSVLGLLVAELLFKSNSALDESAMSKAKSYVVKRAVLCEVANELSLGNYLRLGRGEIDSGGRAKPSILSCALEALLGALYLDAGIEVARAFVHAHFQGRLIAALESGKFQDYKTELQEFCQQNLGALPEYVLKSEEGSGHEKVFHVDVVLGGKAWGSGKGTSKKEAQVAAAAAALRSLQGSVPRPSV